MEEMFSSVYDNGKGYGVLPISSGAEDFRDALLSTLTASLLKTIAPDDIEGLQTHSGGTLSSVIQTLTSSLRESVSRVAADRREEAAGPGAEAVGLEGVVCGFDGDGGDEEEEEEEEYEGAADMEEAAEEGDTPEGQKVAASASKADADVDLHVADEAQQRKARTDYERLLSELSLEELGPVRLALGMAMDCSMQEAAAGVLLDNGLTVQDLVFMGYPQEVVEVLRLLGLKRLEKV
jgi:hypothetical protein